MSTPYSGSIGITAVARHLGVSRDEIRQWSALFAEHLSPGAEPGPGKPRQYTPNDLQVLGLVCLYWDDDADVEYIRTLLNSEAHEGDPRLLNLRLSVSLPFQHPPQDLDESWTWGSLVGGMGNGIYDLFELAESFRMAGDRLVDVAQEEPDRLTLIFPILYAYRHALELYLKASVPFTSKTHDLFGLLQHLQRLLHSQFRVRTPEWFENLVMAFDDFDQDSTAFRYPERGFVSRRTGDSGEFWIDHRQLRHLMGWAAKMCQRIRRARESAQVGSDRKAE